MNDKSHLLIHEYPLVLLPSLACKVGVNEALLLQQIQTLANHSGRRAGDGRLWIPLSFSELLDMFPFWNEQDIRKIIARLEESGILLSHIEESKDIIGGKRKWYAIDYAAIEHKQETTND